MDKNCSKSTRKYSVFIGLASEDFQITDLSKIITHMTANLHHNYLTSLNWNRTTAVNVLFQEDGKVLGQNDRWSMWDNRNFNNLTPISKRMNSEVVLRPENKAFCISRDQNMSAVPLVCKSVRELSSWCGYTLMGLWRGWEQICNFPRDKRFR